MAEGPVRVTQPLLDVLEVLLSTEDFRQHGWAIMKATKRAGPTVYRILDRLREADWVAAEWEAPQPEQTTPPRRFYQLTPNGRVSALALIEERRSSRRQPRWGLGFGFGGAR
ncbi:PadR family transcriptional regulator [Actinoplanes sp. NPDC048988]|uniref:PadR family transcriptional regulator n=1 Tax=Actinoplanes sp. NPDC048988 TaxID=3363901 RepID=UPI0037163C58